MEKKRNVGWYSYELVGEACLNPKAVARLGLRVHPLIEVGRFTDPVGVIHRAVSQDDDYSACDAHIPKARRQPVDIDTPLTCLPCLAEECVRPITLRATFTI